MWDDKNKNAFDGDILSDERSNGGHIKNFMVYLFYLLWFFIDFFRVSQSISVHFFFFPILFFFDAFPCSDLGVEMQEGRNELGQRKERESLGEGFWNFGGPV